jgi:hypothetical protein
MKALKLLCAGFVAVMCISCEDTDSGVDSINMNRQYDLLLSFEDTEGNDLVKGIKATEEENPSEALFVLPDQFTLTASPNRHELGVNTPSPGVVYDDPDPNPDMAFLPPLEEWNEDAVRAEYQYLKAMFEESIEQSEDEWVERAHYIWEENKKAYGDRYRFGIFMNSTIEYDPEKIIYTLVCPHVFGDEAEHVIVSYWRKPVGWEGEPARNHYRACYRVEFDGKDITDILYTGDETYSCATIVLDR